MGAATIKIEGENAFVRVDSCEHHVCPEGDVNLIIPIGVPGDSGLVTLAQFTALMQLYNATLPSYASEEEAIADGKVAGDEWLWADDTDVGIAGDKHIQRI